MEISTTLQQGCCRLAMLQQVCENPLQGAHINHLQDATLQGLYIIIQVVPLMMVTRLLSNNKTVSHSKSYTYSWVMQNLNDYVCSYCVVNVNKHQDSQ